MSRESIRQRLAAAEGWHGRLPGDEYLCPNCQTPWKCNGPHIPDPDRDPALDEFIAHARQDIPALLAVADAAADCADLWRGLRMAPEYQSLLDALDALEALR